MRWLLVAVFILWIGLSGVVADPARPEKPAARGLEPREARDFALQLRWIILLVSQQYVRPVSAAEAAASALRGLYEAAGVRMPASLPAELARATDDERQLFGLLYRTRLELGNRETLAGSKALAASIEAMVQALDPYCALLTGSEAHRARALGPEHGIGLELSDNPGGGPWIVKGVTLGGPAQKAGIQPGDRILHVDGVTAGTELSAILGPDRRGPVHLTYLPQGESVRRHVSLRPEQFHRETVLGVRRLEDNSWDYFLDHGRRIAQVRVASLEAGSSQELARVLAELQAARVRGLLLDLRWCPGGLLDEARDTADLFLGPYNLTYFLLPAPGNWLALADVHLDDHCQNAAVLYRSGQPDDRVQQSDQSFPSIPVVVLVNSETSGGAELVAAVLQDNLRARVAGKRTRGKATVQRIISLSGPEGNLPRGIPLPQAFLKLSAGLLVRPSGKNLNRFPESKPSDRWGVYPDPGLEFHLSDDLSARLHALWQLQDLRPGLRKESLPLDDPAADPQRQAALQALLRLLR
jgi:carboxyl-terminal processing protease